MRRFIMLLTAVGIALTLGTQAPAAEEAAPALAPAVAADSPVADTDAGSKDSLPGKALVEANCGNCHNAALYTEARKVTDMDGLKKKVAFCADGAKLGWTDAQKDAVSAYLNTEYYKFN